LPPPSLDDSATPSASELARAKEQLFVERLRAGESISAASRAVGVCVSTGVRWARSNGVAFTSRAKRISPQVLDALRASLEAGQDRKQVASAHGISVVSINRLLSYDHALRDRWAQKRQKLTQRARRRAWLRHVQEHPAVPLSWLRKTQGAVWTWLYRHDREWLAKQLPSLWSTDGSGDAPGERESR